MADKDSTNLPDKVSWRVVDAWVAVPPCAYKEPYCHVQCPYFYECFTEQFEEENEEE